MRLFGIYIFLFSLFSSCDTASSARFQIFIDPTWASLGENSQTNSIKAFSIELTEEIAKIENLTIVIYDKNGNNLLPSLQNKSCEGILTKMEPHLFYEKQYDFSDVYLLTGPVLVIPVATKASSSFTGKEIAILDAEQENLAAQKYPGALLRPYTSTAQALTDLSLGELDAAIIDVLTAEAFCRDLFQGVLKVELPPLTQEGLRVVTLHQENPELISAFNRGLKTVKENGTYAKLAKKWSIN